MTGIQGSSRSIRIPAPEQRVQPAVKVDPPTKRSLAKADAASNPLHLYGSLVNGTRVLRKMTPNLLTSEGYHGNLMVVRSMLAEMQAAVKRLIEIEEGN